MTPIKSSFVGIANTANTVAQKNAAKEEAAPNNNTFEKAAVIVQPGS